MDKAAMRRRRQTAATRSRPPTTLQYVPDHLLELVIRCLDSHIPLLRAAAVCTRWRRIIDNVLSMLASPTSATLQAPTSSVTTMSPTRPTRRRAAAVAPSSSPPRIPLPTPATSPSTSSHGRAGADHWELVDGRGSRLLLTNARRGFFPDLVVCEPISRRYRRILPDKDMRYHRCLGVFIAKDSHHRVSMFGCFRVPEQVQEKIVYLVL